MQLLCIECPVPEKEHTCIYITSYTGPVLSSPHTPVPLSAAMSRRRSLRSNKASSEAGNKEKLLMSINQDPQLGGEGPEPILSPKSSKEPSGSHLEDELTDILWLEPLMGPPPRKKGQCTQSANRPILQTLVPPSSFPSSPDSSSSKEQNIDISPESSLLPLFKTVTHYSEGFRKVCFVNFDRYPGPGQSTTPSRGSP